jgi:O-antigen ligase
LAGLALLVAVLIFYMPPGLVNLITDAPGFEAVGGVKTVESFRTTVWSVANTALSDFAITGMGLGAFRGLVHYFYPLPGIPVGYEIPHAHNFFLQTGLDFGVPGLAAILIVYIAAIVQLVRLGHLQEGAASIIWPQLPNVTPRLLAIGWMGCMVGQTVYSIFDAVAMGSKPNFVWWWWMALIFAAGNCFLSGGER